MFDPQKLTPQLIERLKRIKAFLFDVDGVLTDGSITYTSQGFETKTFNVLDGHGIKLAQNRGIRIGIITARESPIVNLRAQELGIQDLFQGKLNKLEPYTEFKESYGLMDEEIGYMGDDILDLSILKKVGFSAAPANAHPSVKITAHYVANNSGGHCAVREVLDLLLYAQELTFDEPDLDIIT